MCSSIFLSICPSIYIATLILHMCSIPDLNKTPHALSSGSMSFCPYLHRSVFLSISLSLSIRPSVCLSIYLSIYLSILKDQSQCKRTNEPLAVTAEATVGSRGQLKVAGCLFLGFRCEPQKVGTWFRMIFAGSPTLCLQSIKG